METFGAVLWSIGEVLIPLAVAVLTPLLVALIVKGFQKLGLDVEAVHREAFQKAIEKGALEAVRRAGGPAFATAVSYDDISHGVDQVLSGVPDAVARFKVPTAEIAKRIEAQATVLVQATPAAAGAIVERSAEDLLGRVLGRRPAEGQGGV